MAKLRILVAEDSPTARRLLVTLLAADPELEVVAEARDGSEAIELCKKVRPDLVTMDIQMPVMDGVEATRRIMIESATPVVMVSSLDPSDVRRSMHALNAGALAVLAKPAGPGTPRFERDSRELISTIKAMAQVKLVRRWATEPTRAVASAALAPRKISIVGLVSSTGGPNALRSVLSALPADFAPPILIVQHIAAGFAAGFAEWLASTTKRAVQLAKDGQRLVASEVYVAPDDRHLQVSGDRLVVTDAVPVEGFRPSGTQLLSSLARVFGARAVGVIMTGMGHDGVAGLLALRDAGGAVLAQDEASCDIFGMPGAALKAGAVATTTPLSENSDSPRRARREGERVITDDERRIAAEEGQRRLSYLYEASTTLFVEPLDFARRLKVLTRLLVPDLGDWCWIDHSEHRAVTYHWDASRIESHPRGPDTIERSITIPINASDGVIAHVTLGFVESNRRYRPEDVELATELITRAGWALDAALQYERAVRATTAREDILAVVAHDLRNPLATILMGSSILSEAKLGAEDQRMIDRISRAGERMETLVKDLLDWAAIESGRLTLERSHVTVGALLEDVVDMFAVQARDPRVVVEATELSATELSCDRARTSQVFSNLIGNALKFAPKGTEIRVSAKPLASSVEFAVEDSGRGIAAEHLPHIFERYWQVEGGTAQRHGVGLGLAITHGIVSAQGGSMTVTSEPGKGSRFAFTVHAWHRTRIAPAG